MSNNSLVKWGIKNRERLVAVALLIVISAIYLSTLDNGLRLEELQGGDLITHQYAQVQGRPSNAPGYPLYTMLGWLWFHLGRFTLGHWFSPLEVLSLYSTFWALAALTVFYLLNKQITLGKWPLAALGVLFYTFTYFFWYYAVSTEQYTSAVFQTLLLLLLAILWQKHRQDRYLLWSSFIVGTCAANLVTTLVIVPPLLWFYLSQDKTILRRGKLLTQIVILGLLPLTSYAYVYIRGAQHPEWRGQGQWPSALAWFLDFISTGQGRSEMTLRLWPVDLSYLSLVPKELSWPILVIGLIGLCFLEKKQTILAYSTLFLYLLFSYIDRYGNWFQVIMPAYPIIIFGVIQFVMWARKKITYKQKWVMPVACTLLYISVGGRFIHNLPNTNLHNQANDDAFCKGLPLLQDLGTVNSTQATTIAASYEEMISAQYLQTVYGLGAGLRFVGSSDGVDLSKEYVSKQAALLLPQEEIASLQAVGVSTLSNKIRENNSLAATKPQPFGPLLVSAVLAQQRSLPQACGSHQLVVLLQWQVAEAITNDITVSARLSSSNGPLIISGKMIQDDHPPLWGLQPTSRWQIGQIWQDAYAFIVPSDIQPSHLNLVAYETANPQNILWQTIIPLPEMQLSGVSAK